MRQHGTNKREKQSYPLVGQAILGMIDLQSPIILDNTMLDQVLQIEDDEDKCI